MEEWEKYYRDFLEKRPVQCIAEGGLKHATIHRWRRSPKAFREALRRYETMRFFLEWVSQSDK